MTTLAEKIDRKIRGCGAPPTDVTHALDRARRATACGIPLVFYFPFAHEASVLRSDDLIERIACSDAGSRVTGSRVTCPACRNRGS